MTHINAFFGDVEEKQKAFDAAAAELQAAKDRLELKKKEDGYVEVEPEVEVAKPTPVEQAKPVKDFKKK